MKIVGVHNLPAALIMATAFTYPGAAYSSEHNNLPGDENGFVFFSDSTNENKFGLGGGVGFSTSPYVDVDSEITPFPFVYIDNKWMCSGTLNLAT